MLKLLLAIPRALGRYLAPHTRQGPGALRSSGRLGRLARTAALSLVAAMVIFRLRRAFKR